MVRGLVGDQVGEGEAVRRGCGARRRRDGDEAGRGHEHRCRGRPAASADPVPHPGHFGPRSRMPHDGSLRHLASHAGPSAGSVHPLARVAAASGSTRLFGSILGRKLSEKQVEIFTLPASTHATCAFLWRPAVLRRTLLVGYLSRTEAVRIVTYGVVPAPCSRV